MAQKTTEQANIVADTAVSGANEVAQAAVEGVENAAVASGFVSAVSDVIMSHDSCGFPQELDDPPWWLPFIIATFICLVSVSLFTNH